MHIEDSLSGPNHNDRGKVRSTRSSLREQPREDQGGIVAWRWGGVVQRPCGEAFCETKEVVMFGPITIPFGAKMLFNTVKLIPGVSFDQVEMAVGELCMIVKQTYGGDKGGFIAGQVFKFSGFVSEEGSLTDSKTADEHYAIVTYWTSFEAHEKSHADAIFKKTFSAITRMCSDTKELGYDLLWQGEAKP
ncbi:MAG: hypothetical protein KC590_15935 [Nitrospira sp.]|nr:hypothetical protein [Nitrospira sp.]